MNCESTPSGQAPSAATQDVTSWRPQTAFEHKIDSEAGIDQLNAKGGIAVAFEPLSRSPVGISFSGSQSEGLSIWETTARFGFRTVPKFSADLVSVRFVRSGFITREDVGGSRHSVCFDQGLLTRFDIMQDEWISADSSSITATLPYMTVVQAQLNLYGSHSVKLPSFLPVVAVNTVGLAALRHNMTTVRSRVSATPCQHDMVTSLIEEVMVFQLLSAWPIKDDHLAERIPDPATRAIRLAIEFIEDNLARKIFVADIAAAAGQNIRSLQAGFKSRLDCTLTDYIINRRLDRVHAALQACDGRTVQSVATEWGFGHMGDFGQRYHRRFGASPSASTRSNKR